MIAHIVLFTPKADLTEDEKRSFALSMTRAAGEIGSIRRAFVGRSVDIDAGYSRQLGGNTYKFAAVIEFDSREGLVDYLRHPRHDELGRLFWELCETSVVTEVETRDFLANDLVQFLVD